MPASQRTDMIGMQAVLAEHGWHMLQHATTHAWQRVRTGQLSAGAGCVGNACCFEPGAAWLLLYMPWLAAAAGTGGGKCMAQESCRHGLDGQPAAAAI